MRTSTVARVRSILGVVLGVRVAVDYVGFVVAGVFRVAGNAGRRPAPRIPAAFEGFLQAVQTGSVVF